MSSTETKVRAVFMIEVMGRPPEFLTETLKDLIKKIGEEQGTIIKSSKLNPPVLLKDQKDFFTSFAEVEIETENLLYLTILIFKYMPAYVEIISPQNFSIPNTDLNDVLNELARRLHSYEEITRILQNEKIILENRLRGNIPIIKEVIKEENKSETKKEKKKDKKR
ncbi:Uncharacterised protein [uncultured archaeon]|nr:Uncharacterised protein [uncultured archaeon]